MLMQTVFTPNEASAFVQLPEKRIYKEIEHKIIVRTHISFCTLIYLCALKEVDFVFSIPERIKFHERLSEALSQNLPVLNIGSYWELKLNTIQQELSELVTSFEVWKKKLVISPDIMGGEPVFPNSRLTVRHIGKLIQRGELPENIIEDYPYLSETDVKFADIYVTAYPVVGRPKKHEIFD